MAAITTLGFWVLSAPGVQAAKQSKTTPLPDEIQQQLRHLRNRRLQDSLAARLVVIVYDDNGVVVPDVMVTVQREDAQGDDPAARVPPQISDRYGVATFASVPPGRYVVGGGTSDTDSAPGLTSAPVKVTLRVERITGVEVRVRAVARESIEVPSLAGLAPSGAPSTIEAIFTHQAIENMSLSSGRTLQSLIALMPGASVTPQTGTLTQFTAMGQRRFSNRLTIDGINADLGLGANALDGYGVGVVGSGALPAYGTSGSTQTLVPLGAIQEIQVRTTNAPSEHARTPGAQTAIITRAGGERHSGSGFLDNRPRDLGARDFFDNAVGPPVRPPDYWNSGMTLGGPLKTQRLHYFGVWEHQYINRNRNASTLVPSLALREAVPENLRPVLGAYPLPNGPDIPDAPGLAEFSTQAALSSKLWVVNARLDADLSTRHRLFGRVSRGESSGDALRGAGAPFRKTPALTSAEWESTATNTVTLGLRSGWSSLMHELTVSTTMHDGTLTSGRTPYGQAGELPLDAFVPADASRADIMVGMSGVLGGSFLQVGGKFGKSQTQFQVADNWSLARGRHEWRFGIEYRRATPATDPPSYNFTYNFGPVDALLAGAPPFIFRDRLLPTRTRIEAWAAFLQDRFRVSPRLSVDFGLRYSIKPAPVSLTENEPLLIKFETLPDVQFRPRGTRMWNTPLADIAPRISAGYQLSNVPGRETIVSAGWSLVFDELTSPGAVAFGRGYPFVSSTVVPSAPFPVPPDLLVAPPPTPFRETVFAEAYATPEDLRSPRTYDWRLGIEHALGASQRLGLSYVGAIGRDLIYWHGYDIPGLNGAFQRIHAYSNDATSNYHALLVDYTRRALRGLHGRINYTWSHAIDTDSGEALEHQPPPSLIPVSSNRGSADFDRRHILRVTGSYTPTFPRLPMRLRSLLANWQIDIVGTVQTGTPFTVVTVRAFDVGTYSGPYRVRPDVVPDVPVWIDDPLSPTGQRVNPDAFLVPEQLRQGDAGRNTLRAPALRQVDASLSRSIRLRGRMVAHLRLSAFNVFNTSNFGPPSGWLNTSQFGRPYETYADALGTGSLAGGGLVPLLQMGGPRAVQIGVRLAW